MKSLHKILKYYHTTRLAPPVRRAARVPATRSQPSSDPVNASADLTASVLRASVRGGVP